MPPRWQLCCCHFAHRTAYTVRYVYRCRLTLYCGNYHTPFLHLTVDRKAGLQYLAQPSRKGRCARPAYCRGSVRASMLQG